MSCHEPNCCEFAEAVAEQHAADGHFVTVRGRAIHRAFSGIVVRCDPDYVRAHRLDSRRWNGVSVREFGILLHCSQFSMEGAAVRCALSSSLTRS